jgi:hypothetical protein
MRGVFGVGAASQPDRFNPRIKKTIGVRRLTLWLACVVSLLAGSASAHDASSYGGVFRSRDLGAAWLNADIVMFLNAALVIAVDPRDATRPQRIWAAAAGRIVVTDAVGFRRTIAA